MKIMLSNDDGIEDYVQCKCDEYIDERDKDKREEERIER